MAKKDFTKATTNVADKFFSKPLEPTETIISEIDSLQIQLEHDTKQTNITNIDNDTKQSNDTNNIHTENITNVINNNKHTHVTNKSKHYDERGKREERYGLLLDKQLKEDLKHLANATGSRSINDFIVTILLEYVEAPEHQEILQAYKNILKLRG